MERSDSETESLRAEQGKRPDDESSDDQATAFMSLGSMIRGPIGREGADERRTASDGADDDREVAEGREG
ncbi:MAG TPA: hypothetical protein VFS59_03250 [Gemmatimonadaceae bacterium]|nr:hypothetical protein [Gemmatimonadaceae bacterium]